MLTRVQMVSIEREWGSGQPPGDLDLIWGNYHTKTGYELIEVTGLEPSDAEIQYSNYAMLDGGSYRSSRVTPRNLVFTIGLNTDNPDRKTVKDLRTFLYSTFPTGQLVRFRFWDGDSYQMYLNGYIESYEPRMFSKNPEIQMSVLAPDPRLYKPGDEEVSDLDETPYIFNYEGSHPSGFEIELYIGGVSFINSITIENLADEQTKRLTIPYAYSSGDRLRVNTGSGEKTVTLLRSSGGFDYSVLGNLRVVGDWPVILPGENELRVLGANRGGFSWDLHYKVKYAGY